MGLPLNVSVYVQLFDSANVESMDIHSTIQKCNAKLFSLRTNVFLQVHFKNCLGKYKNGVSPMWPTSGME